MKHLPDEDPERRFRHEEEYCSRIITEAQDTIRTLHKGQTDKVGNPISDHAMRVSEKVRNKGLVYEILALFHDIVEETDITLPLLKKALPRGYEDLSFYIYVLSRKDDQTYMEYIVAICNNSDLVRDVKIADIEDHLDRKEDISESMIKRYVTAMVVLKEYRTSPIMPIKQMFNKAMSGENNETA